MKNGENSTRTTKDRIVPSTVRDINGQQFVVENHYYFDTQGNALMEEYLGSMSASPDIPQVDSQLSEDDSQIRQIHGSEYEALYGYLDLFRSGKLGDPVYTDALAKKE